jgi:hypothetical protein
MLGAGLATDVRAIGDGANASVDRFPLHRTPCRKAAWRVCIARPLRKTALEYPVRIFYAMRGGGCQARLIDANKRDFANAQWLDK